MNTKYLVGDQMNRPICGGWIFVRTFQPEHLPDIGSHKIKIAISIHIMQDTMNTAWLHFGVFGLGLCKNE